MPASWVKCLCCPFILCYESVAIYFFPCVWAYIYGCLWGFCCLICGCCRGLCHHKDKKFPADHRSIGTYEGQTGPAIDERVVWKTVDEVCGEHPALFYGSIEPKDIAQGPLFPPILCLLLIVHEKKRARRRRYVFFFERPTR